MIGNKHDYYLALDQTAINISNKYLEGKPVTELILNTILNLYKEAQVEQKFKDGSFESAYHAPITSEFEFFIARIFYHLSKKKKLNYQISLRKQKHNTAPDIRIDHNGRTILIIEIKAKASWIQPFLSLERYRYDRLRRASGKTDFNPDILIENLKKQLTKYRENFGLGKGDIYFMLPTLSGVHRKKSTAKLKDYYNYFSTTSGLPKSSLILLSKNQRLNLSKGDNEFNPSDAFEKLLNRFF